MDNDGDPVAKYENVPMEEDEDIFYLSRIEGELARVMWAEDENEEKEVDSEGEKEIIVLDDDDEVLDLDDDDDEVLDLDDDEIDEIDDEKVPFVEL
ncbi:MAG TPA: hypothetical protein VIJ46_05470 [Rhabdochlamydiaceae bacterium]